MVYDTIIIGGGVSGLMTAYYLTLHNRRVLVIERGHQFYERHHIKPFDVANGVGGSGLFSDGKVSLYPSATQLWKLEKENLKIAYSVIEEFLRPFDVNIPSFSDEWSKDSTEESSSYEKQYDSIVLSQEQRTMIAFKLIQSIGSEKIIADTEVVRITLKNNAFELVAKCGSLNINYRAHTVVLAGGKHQFDAMLPNIKGIQCEFDNRYEVGIRVECPNSDFDFYETKQPDIKLIEKKGEFEIRTFCCCKGGRVLESCADGFISFNGTSNDFEKSEKSNLGFIVTIPSHLVNDVLVDFLRNKKSMATPLTLFMENKEVFINERVDECLRNFILSKCPKMAHSANSVVYFPEFERFGAYPLLDEKLQLNRLGIWMTGDSTGKFRGLLPAFVSGTYVAQLIDSYLCDYEQELMRQFHIKISAVTSRKVVFTAQSKQKFYCRNAVCEYVFDNDCIPVNPFRIFGYFLDDRVDRGLIRNGNNEMISRCDELWVFGQISDGVLFEIFSCIRQGKPVRFFTIDTWAKDIKEISVDDVTFEPEVHAHQNTKENLKRLIEYGGGVEPVNQLKLFDEF